LHCPGITSEDARKSDLLAELADVMSDGVSPDLVAKNATKPNLFEIIPLQTTGKETNWKT
jgi:hypothetical protein